MHFLKDKMRFLVEESESHIVILFLLGFLLLSLFLSCSSRCGSSSGSSGGSGTATSGWHGGQLGAAFSHDLLDGLAGEFSDDDLQGVGIGLHADGAENLLDGSGGDLFSSEGGQKCSSYVTHV